MYVNSENQLSECASKALGWGFFFWSMWDVFFFFVVSGRTNCTMRNSTIFFFFNAGSKNKTQIF